MGELLAVTCDSCREPMVPNACTLDDDGCGWICLNHGCPELADGKRHYADERECEADAPARAREPAQADLARLHALLLELGRLADGAGALAADLNDALVVSYHSDDFSGAQEAKQALTVAGALCGVLRRTAADAQDRLAGIDAELPGLLTIDER